MCLFALSGYEEDSFLLAWDTLDTHDPDTATPLSPRSTQTLFEMDMPTEPQKCYLFLRDGPDGPPKKEVSEVGVASGGVELASSISSATSSHALNTASNNPPSSSSSSSNTSWASTAHYSNKSDTGEHTNYEISCTGYSVLLLGFVGLVNQAMTCYLNSLLQTLYMTPEFRKALYR